MTGFERLHHRFVDLVPADLEPGILYVTIEYATAVHSCACGCGGRVVTPFTPADWELRFDGETVSLFPSIGNWSFSCQSHYWVRRNRIEWAPQWSAAQITRARRLARKAQAIGSRPPRASVSTVDGHAGSLIHRLRRWVRSIWR